MDSASFLQLNGTRGKTQLWKTNQRQSACLLASNVALYIYLLSFLWFQTSYCFQTSMQFWKVSIFVCPERSEVTCKGREVDGDRYMCTCLANLSYHCQTLAALIPHVFPTWPWPTRWRFFRSIKIHSCWTYRQICPESCLHELISLC